MSRPLKCLNCWEHGEPYDGPCLSCGHYTADIAANGKRIVRHDGKTFAAPDKEPRA